jgi:hypothetical protein
VPHFPGLWSAGKPKVAPSKVHLLTPRAAKKRTQRLIINNLILFFSFALREIKLLKQPLVYFFVINPK